LPAAPGSGDVAASNLSAAISADGEEAAVSESAEYALQEAGVALRHAVEVLRRRPVDDVAAKALVPEFHELRTVMSTAALLMESFGLPRFAGLLHPLPSQADKEGSIGVLEGAEADLSSAFEHLNQAAAGLTAARQKLDTLR
jgi:hypothetical protein